MKKCPNCGRILHDDSIFCFGCMSEINKRQEIVLATPKKVFLKAKITTPIIAVALVSATVFGVYTYNNNSDNHYCFGGFKHEIRMSLRLRL